MPSFVDPPQRFWYRKNQTSQVELPSLADIVVSDSEFPSMLNRFFLNTRPHLGSIELRFTVDGEKQHAGPKAALVTVMVTESQSVHSLWYRPVLSSPAGNTRPAASSDQTRPGGVNISIAAAQVEQQWRSKLRRN
ncbi:hypothetical protein RRG08_033608 [Elysia crispata]|uniref:Uncharacterized protein n=1 Tax=Elysia crispata TaxID=231223 RepID=A0AAE1CKI0_9GAST|nr:hypothetical protein RRG08_033608 [Elysia crispata]